MKTSSLIFLLSYCLIVLSSCSPQKAETQQTTQTEQVDDAIRSLPDYAYTDSVKQGSHEIVYYITSEADSTLKVVEDEDGIKFADNRWKLVIMKDGKQLFNRSFTKADFRSQLNEDFQKYGIMDGLRFHHAMEGKLYFNTCVRKCRSTAGIPTAVSASSPTRHSTRTTFRPRPTSWKSSRTPETEQRLPSPA